MARHAGFSVAVSVGERYLNEQLWTALEDRDPLTDAFVFTLPQTVPVAGGTTVRLSGTALFDRRPSLTCHANNAGTVHVSASAIAFVKATTAPVLADLDATRKVRLTAEADVRIDVELDDPSDGIYLRWQPVGTTLGPLAVQVLEGPPAPDWLVTALSSGQVAQGLTLALWASGAQRITDKLYDRTLSFTQAADFPKTGVSEFRWFAISERVGAAELHVLDGCVSVGIDLVGRTTGDSAQLVDLFAQPGTGPVYRRPVFDNTLPGERPVIVGQTATPATGDVALLVNPAPLAAIAASVSAQVSGTKVLPDITLKSIGPAPASFTKPMRGLEWGLCLSFEVDHSTLGTVTGQAYLQAFLQYPGAWSANPPRSIWRLYVGHAEIQAPWWVDLAIVVAGLLLAAANAALTPVIAAGVIAALDGIVPGLIGQVETQVEGAPGGGVSLAPAVSAGTLATASAEAYWRSIDRIQVNDDGLGVLVGYTVANRPPPSLALDPGHLDGFADIAAGRAFQASLTLRAGLAGLAGRVTGSLRVTRSDNSEQVTFTQGAIAGGLAISWDPFTADLYWVDSYLVTGRLLLDGLLLYEGTLSLAVTDLLDRHHRFVTWPAHWAHFTNPGTGGDWWHRRSVPTLHRTAVAARCLGLLRRLREGGVGPLIYSEALGFDWSQLPPHREQVCDYCFFGGPDKASPREDEDWRSR